ncbi:dihydroxy-acid dehydratase [Salipiger sp.]|uniref:dihydroxy-acid dehydratase n=1 Tax=Salipiger sp. TaxID=2078585 RepID=UPI003A971F7E
MIWNRALAGLAALAMLTACVPTSGSAPLPNAKLAGGEIVVAGPRGYCVDPVTLSRSASRSFAVLASCDILSGSEEGTFVEPMMVTITVGPRLQSPAIPAPEALAAEAGQPFVSGSARDGLATALLGDGGSEVLDNGDRRYWRGAFVENGHLIGLALYAPEGSRLVGRDGAEMLSRVHREIMRLSPDLAPAQG